MIVQQAINMDNSSIPLSCGLKIRKKLLPVPGALENRLSLIASRGDMIEGTRKPYP
jgi:hypothetical protein